MNSDIARTFEIENSNILIKKLQVDVERNSDVLSMTILNIIDLKSKQLFKKIITVCQDNIIQCDEIQLQQLINSAKEYISDDVLQSISEKKEKNQQFWEKEQGKIEKKDIENYKEKITEYSQRCKEDVEKKINYRVNGKLKEDLESMITFPSDELKEETSKLVSEVMIRQLKSSLYDEMDSRDRNLDNTTDESYDYYLKLEKSRPIMLEKTKMKECA